MKNALIINSVILLCIFAIWSRSGWLNMLIKIVLLLAGIYGLWTVK